MKYGCIGSNKSKPAVKLKDCAFMINPKNVNDVAVFQILMKNLLHDLHFLANL